MRFRNFAKLGLLVLSGSMVTGCGTFFAGRSTGLSSQKELAAKVSSVPRVAPKPPSGANVSHNTPKVSDTVVGITSGSTSGSTSGVGVVYPSFGIGVSGPQVLALNERLAQLGYLPVQVAGGQTPQISLQNLNAPPQVNFTWRYQNIPSELTSLWNPTTYTAMTRAAVIAFEHVNGIGVDGIAGPSVWKTILSSNALANPYPYTYVLVQKAPAPETLKVWQAGQWVYQSLANTGIPQMSTTDGTFAVYLRFVSQTMSGTNPNGTHYSDAGVPYVNYFNGGDAIHGFIRASYGFPQSLGCVELPYANAAQVWPLLHYGTLVTVMGHYTPPSPSQNITSSGHGNTASTAPKQGSTNVKPLSSHRSSGTSSGKSTTTKGESKGSTTKTSATPSAGPAGGVTSVSNNTNSGATSTGSAPSGLNSSVTGNQVAPSSGGNITPGNAVSRG